VNLETHLNNVFEHLISNEASSSITEEQLIKCIDLTLLKENSSDEEFLELKHKAQSNKVAAICVYTQYLPLFQPAAAYNLATVVNFPQGREQATGCLSQIDQAIQLGANEIDYVFPFSAYLEGYKKQALDQCIAITESCKKKSLTLKIILETGAFPDMQKIYQVSGELISIGCNFLKTSTGKIAQGASLAAVFAILSAIKDSGASCGVKISGGIKTVQQARNYACLAELMMGKQIDKDWFRIGASSLLDELLNSKFK